MDQALPTFLQVSVSLPKLFIAFLFFLVFLDLTLVRWKKFRLGKKGWKKVDYFWLAIGALGLIAASADARMLIAKNMVEQKAEAAIHRYKMLRTHLQFGTSIAICRKFNRTKFSPQNLDEIQKEFDAACDWFKLTVNKMPSGPGGALKRLEANEVLPIPKVTDPMLEEIFKEYQSLLAAYNRTADEVHQLEAQSSHSGYEDLLRVLAPILLAFALALRITKVTGELKLEDKVP